MVTTAGGSEGPGGGEPPEEDNRYEAPHRKLGTLPTLIIKNKATPSVFNAKATVWAPPYQCPSGQAKTPFPANPEVCLTRLIKTRRA